MGTTEPVSSYSVDSGPSVQVTMKHMDDVKSHVVFFYSGMILNGQHNIWVTNLAEGDFFWFDLFVISLNTVVAQAPVQTTTPTTTPCLTPMQEMGVVGLPTAPMMMTIVTVKISVIQNASQSCQQHTHCSNSHGHSDIDTNTDLSKHRLHWITNRLNI